MPHQSIPARMFPILIESELAVGQLYQVFAGQFPHQADLWQKLAREEQQHATWLIELQAAAADGLAGIRQTNFDLNELKAYLARLQQYVANATAGKYTNGEALAIAEEIESSIIEHEFYEVIDEASDALRNVYTTLKSATKRHADLLAELKRSEQGG